jgi:hypothetical protein
MLTIDPTNPTNADIAWAIGVLVLALIVFYEMIKHSKSKSKKHFDETDIFN